MKTTTVRIACWAALLLATVSLASQFPQQKAGAQTNDETAAQDSPATGQEATSSIESLGDKIFKWPETTGEWFGVVFYLALAIFSVYAASVTFERLLNLQRAKFISPGLTERLAALVRSGPVSKEELDALCEGTKSPATQILHAGLMRAGRSLPEVEKSMEDAAAREMADARSKIRPLSIVGSTAPLVGLLGTVVGMIFAFETSSKAGLGKPELLAEGIYLALLTTAGGLTIAIPCLLVSAWFNSRVESFFREIDECLLETIPSFARMEGNESRYAGMSDAPDEGELATANSPR